MPVSSAFPARPPQLLARIEPRDGDGSRRASIDRIGAKAERSSIARRSVSVGRRVVDWRRRIVDGRRRIVDRGRDVDRRDPDKHPTAPAAAPDPAVPSPSATMPARASASMPTAATSVPASSAVPVSTRSWRCENEERDCSKKCRRAVPQQRSNGPHRTNLQVTECMVSDDGGFMTGRQLMDRQVWTVHGSGMVHLPCHRRARASCRTSLRSTPRRGLRWRRCASVPA